MVFTIVTRPAPASAKLAGERLTASGKPFGTRPEAGREGMGIVYWARRDQ